MVPQISLFGDVAGNPNALFNNIRVYGTILLLLMAVIVFVGVKIVSQMCSIHVSSHTHTHTHTTHAPVIIRLIGLPVYVW